MKATQSSIRNEMGWESTATKATTEKEATPVYVPVRRLEALQLVTAFHAYVTSDAKVKVGANVIRAAKVRQAEVDAHKDDAVSPVISASVFRSSPFRAAKGSKVTNLAQQYLAALSKVAAM